MRGIGGDYVDAWALDLGTTNTDCSYWDESVNSASRLPPVCQTRREDPPRGLRLVFSATHLLPIEDFCGVIRHRFFLLLGILGQERRD